MLPTDFAKSEEGGITPFGLFIGLTTLIVGGVAVDGANLVAVRTQLQVAADFAAHAALYTREFNDADKAKDKALELVEASYPSGFFGDVLSREDIQFGYYDQKTGGFKVDSTSRSAVLVDTKRLMENGNPVATNLLKLVGFNSWDVSAVSVFSGDVHPCMRDGWVGEGVVDAQSNNDFYSGFCVHSNEYVSLNQNNYFQSGVTVSMPDASAIDIPASGFAKNTGLEAALRSGYMNVRILNKMEEIFASLNDSSTDFYRDYLSGAADWDLTGSSFVTSDFKQNRINRISCGSLASLPIGEDGVDYASQDIFENLKDVEFAAKGGVKGKPDSGDDGGTGGDTGDGTDTGGGTDSGGGGKITIDASGSVLQNVVIYTDCAIKFSNNSALENAVVFTTSTATKSITSSQGLRLGKDDDCDPLGGVQIMTYGGFEVAAKLEIYSSQVIAKGPIQFAAQGDGVEGGSFISGSTIDGTSNTQMSSCPEEGMEENFAVMNFGLAG